MPTIVTTPFETLNAYNFVKRFREAGEKLYVAIGGTSVWPDELNPPTPLKTQQEIEDFWNDMIGMQRAQIADLELMVPRVNWVVGMTTLETFDKTDPNAFATDFYIVNSLNEVFQVTNVDTPGAATVTEPQGHNTGVEIDTGDGYGYTFLFTISLQDAQFRLSDNWFPVPILSEIDAEQIANGDVDAYKVLGAKFAFMRVKLDDSATVDGLPDITYRQIAVIANPHIWDGINPTIPATADHYTVSNMPAGFTFSDYSGQLLHIENRPPIVRIAGQFEETNLIFDF